MRKQLKQKKRSCPMCKPHKAGWENRWSTKDQRKFLAAKEQESATRD